MSVDRSQLSSYYFDFNPTGVEEIDSILAAVARAGKSFHHTEWWDDEEMAVGEFTPVALIQQAADHAAAKLSQDAPTTSEAERGDNHA